VETLLEETKRPFSGPPQQKNKYFLYMLADFYTRYIGDPDKEDMPRTAAPVIVDDKENQTKLAIRVPPFWPEEPELWFAQLEGQFALSKIIDDEARYAYVLSRIEPKQAKEIKDVITHSPAQQKYETIKKALIQRLTDSQAQRIRQLLEHEELGDRKPSQFLRHLSTLAGTTVSGELLRTLWLGRLPSSMQAILATRTEDRLEDIAEQADRIHEVNCNKTIVLATSSKEELKQTTLEQQLEMLTKQVSALTTKFSKMKKFHRDRSRSRSRSRFQNYQKRKFNDKTTSQEEICYYHRRFGEEARKCTKPCNYKAKNEEGSH
jgi:hypothetical protein